MLIIILIFADFFIKIVGIKWVMYLAKPDKQTILIFKEISLIFQSLWKFIIK